MPVAVEKWGETPDHRPILLFTLTGRSTSARITNLGASVVELQAPDRQGRAANVNVRHATATDYLENPSSLGAICGRYANRIGRGRFELDGQTYQLALNNGPNHLHGGLRGFNKQLWTAAPNAQGDGVVLGYRSADGEEHYPGALDVRVEYRLTVDDELIVEYEATTDRPTVLNLTNHCYWNLAGVAPGGPDVRGHELQLWADHYLPADQDVLVTGEIFPVAGTPYDFSTKRGIGLHIAETPGGYDHCFVIRGWDGTLRPAAEVREPVSGRVLRISTTEPGVQLYTANHFDGSAVGAGLPRHGAFCLECQHYPDSPNRPSFPATVLRPGQAYRQKTVHAFSVDS